MASMDVSVAHAGDDGSVPASWLQCMSQLLNNSVAKHQYHANNSVDHANNPVAEHHDHANNSVAAHEDGEAGSRQREAEQEVVPSNTASMVEFRKVDTGQMVVPPNAMSATAAAAASIREQPVAASPRAVADQSESLGDQKMPMPAVQMHPAAQCADGHRVVHVVDDWTRLRNVPSMSATGMRGAIAACTEEMPTRKGGAMRPCGGSVATMFSLPVCPEMLAKGAGRQACNGSDEHLEPERRVPFKPPKPPSTTSSTKIIPHGF